MAVAGGAYHHHYGGHDTSNACSENQKSLSVGCFADDIGSVAIRQAICKAGKPVHGCKPLWIA